MPSMESEEPTSETVSEGENRGKRENEKRGELDLNETRNGKKKKKKNRNRTVSFYLPKIGFGCFRVQRDMEGNIDMEVINGSGERRKPTHLLIMVNGLVGRLLHFLIRISRLLLRSNQFKSKFFITLRFFPISIFTCIYVGICFCIGFCFNLSRWCFGHYPHNESVNP